MLSPIHPQRASAASDKLLLTHTIGRSRLWLDMSSPNPNTRCARRMVPIGNTNLGQHPLECLKTVSFPFWRASPIRGAHNCIPAKERGTFGVDSGRPLYGEDARSVTSVSRFLIWSLLIVALLLHHKIHGLVDREAAWLLPRWKLLESR